MLTGAELNELMEAPEWPGGPEQAQQVATMLAMVTAQFFKQFRPEGCVEVHVKLGFVLPGAQIATFSADACPAPTSDVG